MPKIGICFDVLFVSFVILSMLLHPLRFVVPSSPHYIQFALIAIRLTEYVKKPVVSPDNSSILFRVFALFFFFQYSQRNESQKRHLKYTSDTPSITFLFISVHNHVHVPQEIASTSAPPSHAFNFNTLLVVPNFTSPSFGISLSSQSKIQR